MRAVIERDLADITLDDLSTDRRFAIAYNVVLQLAKMVIACAGYRIVGSGHHRTTFESFPLAMGPEFTPLARYFDLCRRKRNVVDYDLASTVSDTETIELVEKASEFRRSVESWIGDNHPGLAD